VSALPKPERVRDREYLAFVRTHPCAVCNERGVQAHHLKTRAAGGSDYHAVPLCADHHVEWHKLGDRTFTERHTVNLWKVSAQLLAGYIDERLRCGMHSPRS